MVIWLNQLFKNWNLFLQTSKGQLLWAIALQPAPPIKLRQNSAATTSAGYPDWLLIGQFPCQSVSKARWRLATSRDSRTSPAFHLAPAHRLHLEPASSGCSGDWEAAIRRRIYWCPQSWWLFWTIILTKLSHHVSSFIGAFILFNLKFVHSLYLCCPHS